MRKDPVRGKLHRTDHRGFVLHPLVLAEVVEAHDRDHAELVRAVQNLFEARQIRGTKVPVGVDATGIPRLIF